MPPAVRQPMFEGTFSITRTLLRAVGGMALALGLIFVPLSPAFSGQIIIIDTNLGATDVYGNGSPPNGSGPPTADTATDNAVNVLSGGAVGGNVYGGYAESYSGAATATGNSAAISGGTVSGSVYGGEAASYSGAATATGNSVTVGGGTVNGDIYGGYTHSDLGAATATGNSV
ncbi:MAG: hypothetical protein LBQ10_05120, partial [Desulfovibrio sp.]|nr:hypothetical protein [Desulfovibrio sp.]